MFGPHTVVRKHAYNCSRIFKAADHILYMWVWEHVHCNVQYIWERVQDEKKQKWQKCPAGTRQTDGKNWGLVWRNRKKISQIIKDYFYLPFFLLIILCPPRRVRPHFRFGSEIWNWSENFVSLRSEKKSLISHDSLWYEMPKIWSESEGKLSKN